MSLSLELLVMIIVQVLAGGLYLGSLGMAIKFIEKQIERLETKQDKHNSIIERTFFCEQSLKSEHKRIDTHDEYIRELQSVLMHSHEHKHEHE